MLYRRRVLSRGNLFVKRNPGDLDFSYEDLNEMVYSGNTSLVSKIFYYSRNLTGSNAYWNKVRQDIKSIIAQEGCLAIFFTLSMAEHHWPDLLSMFNIDVNDSNEVRNFILKNPHIIDWYFTEI